MIPVVHLRRPGGESHRHAGEPVTLSLRHRLYHRRRSPYVWWPEPIVSPYVERLKEAALGGRMCQRVVVSVKEPQ